MNRAIFVPAVILALFYWLSQDCLAQVERRSPRAGAAIQTNCTSTAITLMAVVRGGTVQLGINTTEIPSFQKIFDIDSPQLFQDEVPKHWVTLDDFRIDKCPVNNAQFKSFTDAIPSGNRTAFLVNLTTALPQTLEGTGRPYHAGRPSGSECELVCGCGLLPLGRETAAHRDGVGTRRPWWPQRALPLGQ